MNTETQTLPAEIATAKLVEIVQTAPAILNESKIRHDKAVLYGQNLLDKAEQFGMNDDLDTLMSEYQAKLRVTHKTIYDARRPFTQIVDEVKKEFTALESDIDPAGKANIFFNIQRLRNIFVTDKVAAQKLKDAEVLKKQNAEKEKIEICKQVDNAVNEAFANYLNGVKRAMNNIFEGMRLDTVDTVKKMILATPISLAKVMFDGFGSKQYYTNYLTTLEISEILSEKKTESLFADLNDVCNIDLMEYRRELVEKIPSKQKELQTIASANLEEAARLQKQADDRKAAEIARLDAEAAQKLKDAASKAEVEAAGKTLTASVAAQAELFVNEPPKTKESYLIEVSNNAGYGVIFMFWFEKEGRGLTADKIEKKTIAQMKKFCEDYALKNDEKIVSTMITYTEVYKAK
jgi:hypothetical protein